MAAQLTARTEFAAAINQICNERGIDSEVVLDTIKAAILAAFRKDYPDRFSTEDEQDEQQRYQVDLDPQTGSATIIDTDTKEDITPPGFGRIAAQTAKQVILQRVREAEKDAIISEYQERIGTVISGMVLRFDGKNVIIDIGRGQGVMPPEEQIPSEYYKMNQRLAVYIEDIRDTMRGKTIIVSRSTPELVKELFRREVPEIASGAVEIRAIAREAGHRTKIAVHSTQEGVDPVGSCVGQKGVRVQEVINELGGEKIDIIQFHDTSKTFLSAALSPAEGLHIQLDDEKETATITVPDDQLSLAIGKGGQNVRLAAKLTGYKIDIKGQSGTTVSSNTLGPDASIEELNLSTRVANALTKAGINTLFDLKKADPKNIAGVGPKAQQEIKAALEKVAPPEQSQLQSEPAKPSQSDQATETEAETDESDNDSASDKK